MHPTTAWEITVFFMMPPAVSGSHADYATQRVCVGKNHDQRDWQIVTAQVADSLVVNAR